MMLVQAAAKYLRILVASLLCLFFIAILLVDHLPIIAAIASRSISTLLGLGSRAGNQDRAQASSLARTLFDRLSPPLRVELLHLLASKGQPIQSGLPKKAKCSVTSRMSDNLNSRDRQNAVNGVQHPVQSGMDQFLSSDDCLSEPCSKCHRSDKKRALGKMFLSHSTVH